MKTINMAIIGYGKSAKRYHIPYLLQRDTFNIKYIVELNQLLMSQKHNEMIFTYNIEDALNDKTVELMTICTPPKTHYQLAKQCILHGKHVVIEKPFCTNQTHAKELIDLAKKHNVYVIPYQNRRFDSDYLTLKQVLKHSYVGRVIEIEAHVDHYRYSDKKQIGIFENGRFYGLGIHAIDQMIALFGKPKAIFYDVKAVQNIESNIDDYYDISLFYENMKVILKSSQVVASAYPRFRLIGTKGTYIKYNTDQQENDLKLGLTPKDDEFGVDEPQLYGEVKYCNDSGDWISRKIKSLKGDYGIFYDCLYETIVFGKEKIVSDEEILLAIKILEDGFLSENPHVIWYD